LPATHMGWRLEAQTNATSVGLTSEWFPVPGSTATNAVWIPVTVEEGSVFYRLVNP
jgi:hypothetical protein